MKRIIAAFLLSAALAAPAFAADEGFYIGANVGQSSTDKYPFDTKTGTAFSVLGGYQFMKYVAAEVQYNNLGSPKALDGTKIKIDGYSVAAVGIYPFNDQWSIFAKLGYASTKLGSPVDHSKSDPTWGIGAKFNIDRAWGVRVNYDQYKVETSDAASPPSEKATTSVPSIGVVYKF